MTTERAYTAGDIIAQLLAGNQDYRISHAYIVYENTAGAPTPLVPARADTAGTFHALTAPKDIVRAQVLPTAVIEAVDANHDGNRAVFTVIGTAASGLINGLPFSAAANSKVVSIALVAAPTGSYLGDVLYSHTALADPISVASAGYIGATYSLEID